MTKSRNLLAPRWQWTADQVAMLVRMYPDHRADDVALAIGCSRLQVYGKAKVIGLEKSADFKAGDASGRIRKGQQLSPTTQFAKGNVPPLAGKKLPGYAPGRMGATQFKKGECRGAAALKEVPIGTERTKDGYLWRKVSAKRTGDWRDDWRQVHLLTWEEHHGPIPKGHVVCFLDRNRGNPVIENLECISRQELTRRNTIHRYPPELKQVIRLNGKLKRLINEKAEATTP